MFCTNSDFNRFLINCVLKSVIRGASIACIICIVSTLVIQTTFLDFHLAKEKALFKLFSSLL